MLGLLKQKKGIILHPVTWIVVAFLIGMLVMYLIGTGTIPAGMNFCGTN